MNPSSHKTSVRSLEISIIAFFVLVTFSVVLIYIVDPAIYAQSLSLTPSPADRYPLPVTLFFVGLLIFIALLIFGVRRHWRWLFWLLLIAFGCSVLQFPAALLQFAGILPMIYPLWYELFRLGVAIIEVGLAIWMIRIYRSAGVWARRENMPDHHKKGVTL